MDFRILKTFFNLILPIIMGILAWYNSNFKNCLLEDFPYLDLNCLLPKDPVSKPILDFKMNGFDVKEKNQLNKWSIIGDSLNPLKPKIIVIGTYKTGKTTLVHWLIENKIVIVDSVDNTRGFTIYETPDCYFIDTEGIYQPMENYITGFVRDLIKAFAYSISNEVIIVSEKLYPHEIALIQELSISLQVEIGISIVHNLKSMYENREVEKYVHSVKKLLQIKNSTNFGWLATINNRIIKHYFVYNGLNKKQNQLTRTSLLNSLPRGPVNTKLEISNVLETLSTVFSTTFNQNLKVIRENNNTLKLNDTLNLTFETVDWNPTFFRYTIVPFNQDFDYPNTINFKSNYKILVLECPGMDVKSAQIQYFLNKIQLTFKTKRPTGIVSDIVKTIFIGGTLLLADTELAIMRSSLKQIHGFVTAIVVYSPTSSN